MTTRFDNNVAASLKALGFFDAIHSAPLLPGLQTVTVKSWDADVDPKRGPYIVLKLEDKDGRTSDSLAEAKAKAKGYFQLDSRNAYRVFLSMPTALETDYAPMWSYNDFFRKPLLEQEQLKDLALIKEPANFLAALVGRQITVNVAYVKSQNGKSEYLNLSFKMPEEESNQDNGVDF